MLDVLRIKMAELDYFVIVLFDSFIINVTYPFPLYIANGL